MSVEGFATIVHPRAEDASPVVSLAPRLRTLSGGCLALIDSARHMAGVFLGELGVTAATNVSTAGKRPAAVLAGHIAV
jgi:hypothetical protein